MNRILGRYGRDAIVAIYRDGCGLTADLPDLVPRLLSPWQRDILGVAWWELLTPLNQRFQRAFVTGYENIDRFAAVGGRYWRKGEDGQPMIFGKPDATLDFAPQVPVPDTVQGCNGLAMGLTLFDLDVFRDERVPRPWFRTLQRPWPEYGPFGYIHDPFVADVLCVSITSIAGPRISD